MPGIVTFWVEGEPATGTPGDFLLVPRGQAQTFGNSSAHPARLLVLHAPAADAYFEKLYELWSGDQTPTREDELDLMRQHGMEPA